MSTELIYTDGACSGNGKTTATGGFGIFIAKSALSHPIKINKKGVSMEFKLNGKMGGFFHVTNIRMEGLAIVSTLALYVNALVDNIAVGQTDVLKRLNECDPFKTDALKTAYGPSELRSSSTRNDVSIEIVTDSKFWMDVILHPSWMAKWISKGIIMEKANPDILLMLIYYTEVLKQNEIEVKYTHVRSHQKKGKRTEHADGNDVADVLATSSVNNPTADFYVQ